MKNLILTFLFSLTSLLSFAQTPDPIDSVKKAVQELTREGKLLEVNKLIQQKEFPDVDYPLSIFNYNLQEAKRTNNQELLADTHLSLEKFWAHKADKTKAYENVLRAIEISKTIKNYSILGMSTIYQANLMDGYDEKINKFNEAIEILKGEKDTLNLMRAYLNLGYTYFDAFGDSSNPKEKNQYEKLSQANYTKAKQLLNQHPNSEMQGILLTRQALWFKRNDNLLEYEKYFQEALNYFVRIKQPRWQVYCLVSLADAKQIKGETSDYEKMLFNALEISKEYKLYDYISFIYNNLSELYKETKQTDKALKYTDLYYKARLEQLEKNNSDKLKLLEQEHTIVEKQKNVEKLQEDKRNYLIFSAILIAFLSASIWAIYLALKNKKRQYIDAEKDLIIIEQELDNQRLKENLFKQKDLLNTQYLNSLVTQNQKIEKFLDQFSVHFKNSKNLTKEDFNKLKVNFIEILHQQTKLDEIETISSNNLQEFMVLIKTKHPDLNASDTQLIGYLIEGLNSKEIASELKISVSSVNTKRYRLCKNFKLDNQTTSE